jgi:hypothetical protein
MTQFSPINNWALSPLCFNQRPQTLARRPLHRRVGTWLPELNQLRREIKDTAPHSFYKLMMLAELRSLLPSPPKIEGPTFAAARRLDRPPPRKKTSSEFPASGSSSRSRPHRVSGPLAQFFVNSSEHELVDRRRRRLALLRHRRNRWGLWVVHLVTGVQD